EALLPVIITSAQMAPVLAGVAQGFAGLLQFISPVLAIIIQLTQIALIPLIKTLEIMLLAISKAAGADALDALSASLGKASASFRAALKTVTDFSASQKASVEATQAATQAIQAQGSAVVENAAGTSEVTKKLHEWIEAQKLARSGTGELADAM